MKIFCLALASLAATMCQCAPLTAGSTKSGKDNSIAVQRKLRILLPHGVYCPTKGSFTCLNGKECLNTSMICDGTAHCRDGSDELCIDIMPSVGQNMVGSIKIAPKAQDTKKMNAVVSKVDVKTTTCQSECAGVALSPVCDESTNTQYDNGCLASCEGINYVIGYCGQDLSTIQPCSCEQQYAPVCGANLETYPNSCYAECDGETDYTSGECSSTVGPTTRGCICSDIYDPVCGYNGVVYSNPCEAECAGEQYTSGGCGTVMPSNASSQYWKILSGAGVCSLSSDGRCVSDLPYKNNDDCLIQAQSDVVVSSTTFSTESCCDHVVIDGFSYSGTDGPTDVEMTAGSNLTWTADGSITEGGWTICVDSGFVETTAVPTESYSQYWDVESGTQWCHISNAGQCVTVGVTGSGYSNNEECTVRAKQFLPNVSATAFETEQCCDHVTINEQQYSGTLGPEDVNMTSGSTLMWSSDGSVTYQGFTICAFPVYRSQYWYIESGTEFCALANEGTCVTNEGHGVDYTNDQQCTIIAETAISNVTATSFSTESGYDPVTINGVAYSGTTGPVDVSMSSGSSLTWSSDGSDTSTGWTICAGDNLPTSAYWSISSGAQYCQFSQDGKCVSDLGYGNNENCNITAKTTLYNVTAIDFDTESCCDHVVINGKSYSGLTGPKGVVMQPGAVLTWSSDYSVTETGWTICAEPEISPYWDITSGSEYCEITAGGRCVTDLSYTDDETCYVTAKQNLYNVSATYFDTEECCDHITIGGTEYSGTVGPVDVQMTAGQQFTWASDGSVTYGGWTICGEDTSQYWRILNGSEYCSLSNNGRCVQDLNYQNNEACAFVATQDFVMNATQFDTEQNYDFLTVGAGGVRYSGTTGPHNVPVTVNEPITWESDISNTGGGWIVCAVDGTSSSCPAGEFECTDGSGCVSGGNTCDSVCQCNDCSDERDCSTTIPPDCPVGDRCNGYCECVDCADESPSYCESICGSSCPTVTYEDCISDGYHWCTSGGGCVQSILTCNGSCQCPDCSDETAC